MKLGLVVAILLLVCYSLSYQAPTRPEDMPHVPVSEFRRTA